MVCGFWFCLWFVVCGFGLWILRFVDFSGKSFGECFGGCFASVKIKKRREGKEKG